MSTPIVPGPGPDQYWPPVPTPAAAPPPQRRTLLPWIAVGIAIVFLAGISWVVYASMIKEDSGVAACKAMRDNAKTAPAKNSTRLTEPQYRQLRAQFKNSHDDDIRDHGTKLVDIVWQMSKPGSDQGLGALAYMGPLMTQATALQSACADRGVIVDMNLGGAPAASSSPAVPTVPACSDVFRPGQVIDEAKATAGCLTAGGTTQFIGAFDCADGSKLFQVDASTGAPAGYGFGGKKYVASSDSASDPKYSKAYQSCLG